MTTERDLKAKLDRLLEVGVYAPVGFLVTRSKTVPDLATAGRKQIAFAKSLGQAALKTFLRGARGGASGSARDGSSATRTSTAAPAQGTSAPTPDAAEAVAVPAFEVDPAAAVVPAGSEARDETVAEIAEPAEAPASSLDPADAASEPGSGEIADYDTLTAKEIIELVRTGDDRRARWVHERETRGKGRVTVLRAALKAMAD